MKKPIFGVVAALVMAGCGRGSNNAAKVAQDALTPASHIDLEGLLKKSRAELATEAAELEKKIRRQDDLRHAGKLKFALLPETRVPLAQPVWRESQYSAERGFSVPPYLSAGAKDTPLARHVARHGDHEAATGLAEPGDDAALSSVKLDRNYPLEWTRLVGLLLHHAQFTLATGNLEGAKELVALHQQLRSILPDATRKSTLGQALLPRGLDTLHQAAQVWRKQGREELAAQAEQFIAKQGDVPTWQWPLPADRASLSKHLGLGGAAAAAPAAVPLRALDLSCLPMAHDHLDAAWAFFDGQAAQEVLFAFRSTMIDYQQAGQLVPHFDLLKQSKPAVSATLTPNNPYAGGVVQLRFGAAKPMPLARDFGPVSLDRTFEQNRRLFAWRHGGATVTVKDAKSLATVPSFTPQRPKEAVLERDADQDLLKALRLTHAPDPKQTLATVAAPLWQRFGASQVQADRYITLAWSDGTTRVALVLPNDIERPVLVEATDNSGRDAAKRLTAARARDQADRQARVANNQPLSRLPRNLETLSLGMKRADVERIFPGGANAFRRDIPNGLMASYPGNPTGPADTVLRTLFARFDDADQLVEVRARYADHPGNRPGTLKKRLDALQAAHGSGEATPLNAALAVDLPERKGTLGGTHVWLDDVTRMTCTLEAGSLEMTVRHCSAAHPEGEPLAAFAYLPRGAEEIVIGMPRSEVLGRGATAHEGGLVLKTKANSPFDSVLVSFDNDRAVQVVARYRNNGTASPAQQVAEAWGRDLRSVGWPWRQDSVNNLPQSWTTSDEQTRYRVFRQEDNLGNHLLVEWRAVK